MSVAANRGAPAAEAWELLQRLMYDVHRPRFLALCSELDVTPPQLFTLQRLDADRAVPMSELAKWLKCDASNVTGIVDRLEARGLVERRGAPGDRRVKMLALTEEGAAFQRELSRRMAEPPAALLALPIDDQRALRDIMRRALG
ncbi:MAG TPA: MarR family transcriptional regulator [Candidatus Limnocylindria bacterium]|jgi:DNA-binding MarR family transcriptional regulator|nr:MarR family transcriptional regulator [Candidatus Limnocylindria bacterium]